MNIFLDSSALAMRYIEEDGSEQLDSLVASAGAVALSVLTPVEVASALARRRRESVLNARQYGLARNALAEDLADFTLVGVTEDVIRLAIGTIERTSLRASDAIHVASAVAWSADLFVSGDSKQVAAAVQGGLKALRLPPLQPS